MPRNEDAGSARRRPHRRLQDPGGRSSPPYAASASTWSPGDHRRGRRVRLRQSHLALSLLNAVQPPGRIAARAASRSTASATSCGLRRRRELRKARGRHIGYVFQAAQNSLNPLKTVGKQLLDLGRSHGVDDLRGPGQRRQGAAGPDGTGRRPGARLPPARAVGRHAPARRHHARAGAQRAPRGAGRATTALDMITQANILQIIREVHDERGLTTLVDHPRHRRGGRGRRPAGRHVRRADGRAGPDHGGPRRAPPPLHPGPDQGHPAPGGDIGEARALPGRPPTLGTIPEPGCVFRERCPLRMDVCDTVDPARWSPRGAGSCGLPSR